MGNEQYKKLGIAGGLGPAATAALFLRIVELTQVGRDQDHLDITILNRPQTPDRTAYILGESSENYIPVMHDTVMQLESLGCGVVCVACVTAHNGSEQWAADLSSAKLVHMPREVARYLALAGKKRVGILATDGTRAAHVLQSALEEQGLEFAVPDEASQAKLMSLIYDEVKSGKPANMETFNQVAASLAQQGCDSVILGCTELSTIGAPPQLHNMLVADAQEVLAIRCVQECGAPVNWENTALENVYGA